MSGSDLNPGSFEQTFRSFAQYGLPIPPDPNQIAAQLVMRDQRRTRVLAGLSLFFWFVGTLGMFVLMIGLNQFILFIRIADWDKMASPSGASTTRPYALALWDRQMLWGTSFLHHSIPFVCGSILALLLAALCTVLLVFSSRRATISQINASLMLISAQLKQAGAQSSADFAPTYDRPGATVLPPARFPRRSVGTRVLVFVILMLLAWMVCSRIIIRHLRSFADEIRFPNDMANSTRFYPLLSPFESIHWQDGTPTVKVNGTWYELLAFNDLPTSALIEMCKRADPGNWQKRFDEDLVSVMIDAGHAPGTAADLRLREQATGRQVTLNAVPMTFGNREAIWSERNHFPQ